MQRYKKVQTKKTRLYFFIPHVIIKQYINVIMYKGNNTSMQKCKNKLI